MNGFTHLAELYGFRCWFNEDTNEVKGTNWFNDKMIDIMTWIDVKFEINDGFYIKVIERL
ncbi:hypothetical protein [Sphingobacterium thalpophilum]|uniref:hypothetical protein n=1 Tax=Sphingobacterium thalpophilum TaxID=259 RepID=UPI0024A6166C|nr:hypothetical protein [Sphingobacterium thalpophilum]